MAKRSSAAPKAKATQRDPMDTAFLHVPVIMTKRDTGIDQIEIEHLSDLTKETLVMELSMWTGQVIIWQDEVASERPTSNARVYLDEAVKNRTLFENALARKAKP